MENPKSEIRSTKQNQNAKIKMTMQNGKYEIRSTKSETNSLREAGYVST